MECTEKSAGAPTAKVPRPSLKSNAFAADEVTERRDSCGDIPSHEHPNVVIRGKCTDGHVPGLKSVESATVTPASSKALAGGRLSPPRKRPAPGRRTATVPLAFIASMSELSMYSR